MILTKRLPVDVEQDMYHMGISVGPNVTILFTNAKGQRTDYLIIVDKETGERIKIAFVAQGLPQCAIDALMDASPGRI